MKRSFFIVSIIVFIFAGCSSGAGESSSLKDVATDGLVSGIPVRYFISANHAKAVQEVAKANGNKYIDIDQHQSMMIAAGQNTVEYKGIAAFADQTLSTKSGPLWTLPGPSWAFTARHSVRILKKDTSPVIKNARISAQYSFDWRGGDYFNPAATLSVRCTDGVTLDEDGKDLVNILTHNPNWSSAFHWRASQTGSPLQWARSQTISLQTEKMDLSGCKSHVNVNFRMAGLTGFHFRDAVILLLTDHN